MPFTAAIAARPGASSPNEPGRAKLAAGEFLLIAPERDPAATSRYGFLKFGTGDEIVAHTLKLVRWVSHSTQALVSFAHNLKTAGLLYPGEIPGAREMISQPPDWPAPPW